MVTMHYWWLKTMKFWPVDRISTVAWVSELVTLHCHLEVLLHYEEKVSKVIYSGMWNFCISLWGILWSRLKSHLLNSPIICELNSVSNQFCGSDTDLSDSELRAFIRWTLWQLTVHSLLNSNKKYQIRKISSSNSGTVGARPFWHPQNLFNIL